ncbi:hypothetical protein A0256_14510 [Mucilaginibacter sp. PAMC 26640]|nr:hypothetical protein A0256_14510 [Mucilaginibacter sp. PAMC 26640]
MLCIWTTISFAQSDNYYKGIVKAVPIFKTVNNSFIAGDYKTAKANGEHKKVPYKYSFSMPGIKLEYCYPQIASDGSCSYFIINNQRVDIKGKYESDFACDLDISSFKVYQGSFKGRKYVLLTCINTGSGSSSSSVICNLFDITNKGTIKYYPLWSKYGSQFSFGDFNKDGNLDFLQSRIQGENDILKVTLSTLKSNKFEPIGDKYIILKQSENSLTVLKRQWID